MKRWTVIILGLILVLGLTNRGESALIDYKLSGRITGWEIEDWNYSEHQYPTDFSGISIGDHFKINFTLDTSYGTPSYEPTFPTWDIKIKQYDYIFFNADPYFIIGSRLAVAGWCYGEQCDRNGWFIDSGGGLIFDLKSGEPVSLSGIENILNLNNFYAWTRIVGYGGYYNDGTWLTGWAAVTGEIDKLKTKYRPDSDLSASVLQASGNFVGTMDTLNSHTVPEPSTLLLVGSGLMGLAWFGRRMFKK